MASSLSYFATFRYARISCSSTGHDPNGHKVGNLKINGNSSLSATKVDLLSHTVYVATATSVDNGHIVGDQFRQNIPTKKQFVDPYRQGLIIEEGVGYRQTVVIRSYEVGPDKTATLESILNLLQVKIVHSTLKT